MTSRTLKELFNVEPAQKEVDAFVDAAAAGNNAAIGQFLKKYGPEAVDKRGSLGWIALMYAAQNGHKETAEVLLEAGANPDEKNSYGMTALMWAAVVGCADIAALLLEKGADAGLKDNADKTGLMFAASNGHLDVVRLLLQKNADIEEKDKCNFTALLLAARGGHADVVELLLENGADINARSDGGYSAEMHAFQGGHDKVTTLLEGWPQVLAGRAARQKKQELDEELQGFSRGLEKPIQAHPPLKFTPKRKGPAA